MRRIFLIVSGFLLFLAGCHYPRHKLPPPNPAAGIEAGAFASGTAKSEVNDICETESLGVIRAQAGELQNCPECESDTIVLVSEFFNEIDASYRIASTSCRAYARCMQNNFYDEAQCRSTLASWERARDDFGDLSRELREIEAEVRRDRISGKGGKKHYRLNKHECDCSESVGGVFANCCDHDSDHAYQKKSRY